MKKFYAMLALASAMTASAAVPAAKPQMLEATATFSPINVTATVAENHSSMLKAPATADVNNYWGFEYRGMTKQDSDPQIRAVELRKISDTQVQIFGLGIFGEYPLTATYSASKQTLTLKKQVYLTSSQVSDRTGGQITETIMFWPVQVSDSGRMEEINEVVFTYCPEGAQFQDGSTRYVGGWVVLGTSNQVLMFNTQSNFDAQTDESMNGWVGSWKYVLRFPVLSDMYPDAGAFVFDESEWTSVGKSTLTDNWLLEDLTYEVETYQNKANPNDYVLVNPYGTGTPYAQYNDTPSMKGYIYLNVENPECVLVKPHVISGFTNSANFGFEAAPAMTTRQGIAYYLAGYDIEDIIEEAEMFGDELAVMDENREIIIPNCVFQNVPYFEDTDINYWINKDEEPLEMTSKVVLAAGAGVNGILNDAENAPVRYFNLQGVEIANPEAGQLVIVKEGKKATKTIVK